MAPTTPTPTPTPVYTAAKRAKRTKRAPDVPRYEPCFNCAKRPEVEALCALYTLETWRALSKTRRAAAAKRCELYDTAECCLRFRHGITTDAKDNSYCFNPACGHVGMTREDLSEKQLIALEGHSGEECGFN